MPAPGLILTSTTSLASLKAHLDAGKCRVLKVVTGWGWPWDEASRRAVAAMTDVLIVRTVAGDPSYNGGAKRMPIAADVVAEIAPWYAVRQNIVIEIGNEPLIDAQPEAYAWIYLDHLNAAIRACRDRFPHARILAPAHLVNHHIPLGNSPDGVARFVDITKRAYQDCSSIGIHAYNQAQLDRNAALYANHGKPLWLTEFALNEQLSPQQRGAKYRAFINAANVAATTIYHLDELGGSDPAHFRPEYRLDIPTLTAMAQPITPSEPTINRVPMTRKAYDTGRTYNKQPVKPRLLVMHATAGSYPGDYGWLKRGGDPSSSISCHYYIRKNGEITQFVDETDTAWHCGASVWTIDGVKRVNANPYAIGIELENANNGKDPYPQAQVDAALWLVRGIVQRHNIPRSQVARHLDISPGRKTDPAAFPWADFLNDLYPAPDHWHLWGDAYPLPVEQRTYAIPEMWHANAPWLGAATGPEVYPDARTAFRAFAGGWIVYDSKDDRATLGKRVKL